MTSPEDTKREIKAQVHIIEKELDSLVEDKITRLLEPLANKISTLCTLIRNLKI